MKRLAFFSFLLFCAPAFAQEPPIQDFSLPPEQSVMPPEAPPAPSLNIGNMQPLLQAAAPAHLTPAPSAAPSKPFSDFMEGYCDPGFMPAIADNAKLAGMEFCLESLKKQSCDTFAKLPPDAQSVLNDAINCMDRATEGDQVAQAGFNDANNDSGCAGNDFRRLELLKKYWRDPPTAYALTFLPDDVLKAPGQCAKGGN